MWCKNINICFTNSHQKSKYMAIANKDNREVPKEGEKFVTRNERDSTSFSCVQLIVSHLFYFYKSSLFSRLLVEWDFSSWNMRLFVTTTKKKQRGRKSLAHLTKQMPKIFFVDRKFKLSLVLMRHLTCLLFDGRISWKTRQSISFSWFI
jgi:hypothetical protein